MEILSHGHEVKVLRPEKLKAEIKESLENSKKLY
jgi:predicted DNA-binding transcriptional regulator YafY